MKTAQKAISVVLSIAIIAAMIIGLNLSTAQGSNLGLYVNGTKLYDGNGVELTLRGVNVAHAWYSWATDSSLKAIASLGANSVRVVCADGQRWGKTSYSELNSIINTCRNLGMVCVLEVHDTTGSDSTYDLNNAVNYWIEMKDLLNNNSDYVIVNIGNEWMGTWNKGYAWADANKNAIKTLRNAGIKNVLMVDAPGYGQETQPCIDYCKDVVSADSTGNTVMSMHMYSVAGANASVIKNNITGVLNKGCCLVIGEFGDWQNGGDVDEYAVMNYCQQYGVGYLAWSWYGNSGGDENLDITKDYSNANSLTTYGKTVFYDTNGIKNTSVPAYTCYNPNGGNATTTSVTTKATTKATTVATATVSNGSATRYEFENATLAGNAVVENPSENVNTASNGKIVKFQNGASSAYYNVNIPASGNYTIKFSAVGLGSYDRQMQFFVGDKFFDATVPASGWKEFSYDVYLNAGNYNIGAKADGSWGWRWEWSYVDYFEISGVGASTTTVKTTTTTKPTTTTTKATTTTTKKTTTTTKATTTTTKATTASNATRYEFESATLSGNAVAEKPTENVNTASNGKIVKFQNGANKAYKNVNITKSGYYTVKFSAVGLGSYGRKMQFFIDNNYYDVYVPNSGWTEFSYTVYLTKGTKQIGAKADGSWGWEWEWSYVDYFEISKN